MSLRQWFVVGEGIDRSVITADIQRYLGNDATVKPGMGTSEYEGVPGFWIKAYRNLTSAMVSDLRADSTKWWNEQRRTGSRATPYEKSNTYMQSNAALDDHPRQRDVQMDPQYGGQPGRDRPDPRWQGQPGAMDIDQQGPSRGQPGRQFQQDTRGYQDENMYDHHPDRIPVGFQPDMPMVDQFGRPIPGNPPYNPGQNYPPNHPYYPHQQQQQQYQQPQNEPPPGFVRQGNSYVPITSSYVQPGVSAVSRPEPPYGQPQPGYNQRGHPDQRGPPRDSGYGQAENPERYAYPSPATTVVSSANPRDRDPLISPPHPSAQGFPQQFDQFGRPIPGPANPYENIGQGFPTAPRTPPREQVPTRGPPQRGGRQQQQHDDRQNQPSDEERDVRRRRRN